MATCFIIYRTKSCRSCDSTVREILGIRVPNGTTSWEWEFVNNRPITHYQDAQLRTVVQEQFPRLVNSFGEIGLECTNGHINATNFTLHELSRAVEFESHRNEWELIGPIEYDASDDVQTHLSQSRDVSFLRRANFAQSMGEAIFIPKLAAACHRNMLVIPQVSIESLVVSLPSLLAYARDISDRFMTWDEITWNRFSNTDNGYVWRQSIDAIVCLVYAGEIRPVLAIEIDGYGGRIDSDFAYCGGTRSEESAWNMENKLELLRLLGMECLVLPTDTIYAEGDVNVNILTADSGIVEVDVLTQIVSATLLDYANAQLDLPLIEKRDGSRAIGLTSPQPWTVSPDPEIERQLRQSAMPGFGRAQNALINGLIIIEEERLVLSEARKWVGQRLNQSDQSLQMLFDSGNPEQLFFLCMTAQFEGTQISRIQPVFERFFSNLRDISHLTLSGTRIWMIQEFAITFGISFQTNPGAES